MSTVSWGTAASAHLAGNAAGKVVPGGPATAGVVQGRLLIQSGQSPSAVASAITAMGLLTTGVLLMLPVLTVPALLIGPPHARRLELGLVTSLVVGAKIFSNSSIDARATTGKMNTATFHGVVQGSHLNLMKTSQTTKE